MKFLNPILLQRVPFQMGLQKKAMVVGGKGCDMIQIIFPPNEKNRRDRGLSYSPSYGPEKSRKELRNPCPTTCRKKCQRLIFLDKVTINISELLENWECIRVVAVYKQYDKYLKEIEDLDKC